jgi:soluble lytic murein transglycosylase-like protein
MTAKSAPQLTQAQQPRSAKVYAAATLILLGLVLGVWNAAPRFIHTEPVVAIERVAAPGDAVPVQLAAATPVSMPDVEAQPTPEDSRLKALAEFLARRYKVSQSVTLDLVTIAHGAGQQLGLDPLLIIAVMAIESRFNPIAESVAGAKGLMQVIPKYHVEKFRAFGGEQYAVFDPETNIRVGARILKEYLSRTGHLESALQMYAGALDDDEDTYTGKVMNEKQRLQQVWRKLPTRRPDVEASVAHERLALADIPR